MRLITRILYSLCEPHNGLGAPRARPSAFAEATADKPERSDTAMKALARRSLGEGGSDGVGESEGRSPSDLVR